MTAEREFRAEVVIGATPDQVWAVLSDLDRMPGWSPETLRMIPLGRGDDIRVGRMYLGINRRKYFIWPTRNRIGDYDIGRRLSWDTLDSGARWIYELEPDGDGTLLTERRPIPRRITKGGRIIAKYFLGGVDAHADELEAGMRATLDRIKAAVEQR